MGEDIDIFFCKSGKRNGQKVWLTGNEIISEDFFNQFESIYFLRREYQVPHPAQAYLRYVYGDDWSKKNETSNYWLDKSKLKPSNKTHEPQLMEAFALLKNYLEQKNLAFCLLGPSCRAAAMQVFIEGHQATGEPLMLGMYRIDQQRFLEGISNLSNLGFVVQRASYMWGSVTRLEYKEQQIQIRYLFVPELNERLKNCRWRCGLERFPQDFFSRFDSLEVQGQTLPVPQCTKAYLDYLYGAAFWTNPDFQPNSDGLQIQLAKAILSERKELEIPVKEPWLPFRDNLDNMMILYGDTLMVHPLKELAVGMVVVAQINKRLGVRYITDLTGTPNNPQVSLGELSSHETTLVATSHIIGQAIGVRSHRLKCTVSLKSKGILSILRAILPVVRYLKK